MRKSGPGPGWFAVGVSVCLVMLAIMSGDRGSEASAPPGEHAASIRDPDGRPTVKAASAPPAPAVSTVGLTPIPAEIDLGTVPVGAVVHYTAPVINLGLEPVRIASTHSSCGCTVASIPDKPIVPGETIGVDVQLRVSSRPRPEVRRVVRLLPAQGSPVSITLLYKSTDVIQFERRSAQQCAVRLITGGEFRLELSGSTELVSIESPGEEAALHTLVLGDRAFLMPPSRMVRLSYAPKGGETQEISVPASFLVAARTASPSSRPVLRGAEANRVIQASPRRIDLGRFTGSTETELILDIPELPGYISARMDEPGLHAKVVGMTEEGGRVRVRMRLSSDDARGRFGGRIHLSSEAGNALIRVRGVVVPSDIHH